MTLLFLTISGTIPTANLHAAESRPQPQAELEAVTAAIADIESWLETANSNYSREEQNLRDAETRLSDATQEVAALERALTTAQTDIEALEVRRRTLEDARSIQSAQLGDILRAAYMAGDQNLLKLLLNEEDPNRSGRLLHYYRRYSESQLDALRAFQTTLDELDGIGRDLEQKSLELTQQQQRLQTQQADLAQAFEDKQLTVAQLQASIRSRGTELENLQVNQQELQALIEQINQAIERIPVSVDSTPFIERRGRLPLPVAGAIASTFGSRYGDGNLRRQGISISAEPGSQVLAVHPGRVVFADWLRGAGLLLILDHGDGYMSLYGNNQALAKTPGDRVNAGEVLATSGGVASDTQSGLYFEIRHHGTPQDPADWLQPR